MNRRRFTIAALPALALGAQGREDEILQAEKAWVAAITKNDAAALNKVLADELVYTHSTGIVDTKKSYMDSLNGPQKYASVDYEDVKVTRYGDAALLTAKVRMQGSTKGVPFNNVLRVMHVWAKKGGQWRLAGHQTTRLP